MDQYLCIIGGCDNSAVYYCSVCNKPLCEEHAEFDFAPVITVSYCPNCYEAWKKSLQDGKVGEAGAIYAFMGWLTSRYEVSGPFSAKHEASQAAELVGKFCKMQGWDITDERWHRHIKPYDESVGRIEHVILPEGTELTPGRTLARDLPIIIERD